MTSVRHSSIPSVMSQLYLYTKEETGVRSPFFKSEKIGDWFVREFGEWFHTKGAKMH
jgi:hypothetical protein